MPQTVLTQLVICILKKEPPYPPAFLFLTEIASFPCSEETRDLILWDTASWVRGSWMYARAADPGNRLHGEGLKIETKVGVK